MKKPIGKRPPSFYHDLLMRKYKYYHSWYSEMSHADKLSIIGKWVYNNLLRIADALEYEAKQLKAA